MLRDYHAIVLRSVAMALAAAAFLHGGPASQARAADPAGAAVAAPAEEAIRPAPVSREAALYWERYQKLQGKQTAPAPSGPFIGKRRLDEVEKMSRATASQFKTVRKAVEDSTERYERLLKRMESIEHSLAPRLIKMETTIDAATTALKRMSQYVDALSGEENELEFERIRKELATLGEQLAAEARTRSTERDAAQARAAELDTALRTTLGGATRQHHEWLEQSRAMQQRLDVLETGTSNTTAAVNRLSWELAGLPRTNAVPELGRIEKSFQAHRATTAAQLQDLRGSHADAEERDNGQDARLAALAKEAKALQAALAAKPVPSPENEKALTELATRVGAVEKTTTDTAARVARSAALRQDVDVLKKNAAMRGVGAATLGKDVAELQEKAASREQALGIARTEAQKRDEALDRRLSLLYKQVASLPREQKPAPVPKPVLSKEELAELRTRLTGIEDAGKEQSTRMGGLLAALDTATKGNSASLKKLGELEETLKTRVQPLEDASANWDKALAAINKGLTEQGQKLERFAEAAKGTGRPAPAAPAIGKKEVAALQARLADIEKVSESLSAETAALKKGLASSPKPSGDTPEGPGKLNKLVLARVAPLEVSLGETRKAVSGIGKHLAQNSGDIEELKDIAGRLLDRGQGDPAKQSGDIRALRKTVDTIEEKLEMRIVSLERDRGKVAAAAPEQKPEKPERKPQAPERKPEQPKAPETPVKEDPAEVADLITRARVLASQGEAVQAEELFRQALEKREKALGPVDTRVAASLTDLGLLLLGTGKLEGSELYLIRALELYRRVEGEKHQHVGTALNNVAKLREKQGNFPEAAALYEQAVETFEKTLGSKHAYIATTLSNLGMLRRRQKDYEGGEDDLRRCLKIRERALEKTHPKVAETLNNLALLYLDWDKPDRCEPLFERALEIYTKAYGQNHVAVRSMHANMAAFYARTGEHEKAQKHRAMLR